MGDWVEWKGGRECPVPPETLVYVELGPPTYAHADRKRAELLTPQPAGRYRWSRDSGIIAYRVIEGGRP